MDNVAFYSIRSRIGVFPSTIKNQKSTFINRDSTPGLAGQAKATSSGRGRLLYFSLGCSKTSTVPAVPSIATRSPVEIVLSNPVIPTIVGMPISRATTAE